MNSKLQLVKRAIDLAKEMYPQGFNKIQLIECSKLVYGGFAADPFKQVKTLEDVEHKRNYFAFIDGHYPASMSGCYVVGISGGCGLSCPVLNNGECDIPEEFTNEQLLNELENGDIDLDTALNLVLLYPNVFNQLTN